MNQSGAESAANTAAVRSDAPPEAMARAALAQIGPAVRRYVFAMGASWEDAEDVAQESLLKAWRSWAEFGGRSEVRTWVFRIARNQYLDVVRRRGAWTRRQDAMALNLAKPSDAGPSQAVMQTELALAVERAMETLPGEQREALALRESGGLSFHQIAELLEVSPNTVKSRVRYALLKLAEELKPFDPRSHPPTDPRKAGGPNPRTSSGGGGSGGESRP